MSPRLTRGPVCPADRPRAWKGRDSGILPLQRFVRRPRFLRHPGGALQIYRLDTLSQSLGISIRAPALLDQVLLEAALRTCDGYQVTEDDVRRIAGWTPANRKTRARDPLQAGARHPPGFHRRPVRGVDLAAMRDAVKRLGGDAKKINPLVPVDLVIDHSVQVDVFGNVIALERNAEIEFERNRERYEFLRWGQKAFANFRVVPPATGIVHQVNLEYLARGVLTGRGCRRHRGLSRHAGRHRLAHHHDQRPGVVGWGVGGIEAEAVMLGQPLYHADARSVVGFKLTGGCATASPPPTWC